jgi:3-oxoacyl-[acyl-carrier protein] reductase
VNAVNPGLIETEGTKNIDPEFKKHYLSQTPLGRTGVPQDIGPAVVFLASDESSWMTGECLFISGGFR